MSSTITVDGVTYGENMVRHLQQQVNDCRERGFIDDAGNVRKVLGILALTKDGCVVVSSKWSLWHPDAGEVFAKAGHLFGVSSGGTWEGSTMDCYSTKEAASAARSNP